MESCCGVIDSSTRKFIIFALIGTLLVSIIIISLTAFKWDEHRMEEGVTSLCHHGVFGVDHICLCDAGWTGTDCNTNEHSNKSEEGATCHHGVFGVDHICLCDAGWTGTDCNTTIDDCLDNTYCQNGGTCMDKVNSFVCDCATGWKGKYCAIPEPDLLNTGICGTRTAAQRRIVGGQNALPGKWPWAAFIQNNKDSVCGASLLNKEWAVTAAHCKSGDKLVFGDINKNPDSTSSYRQETSFTSYCHANYNESDGIKYDNDICLLKLHTPVNYTNYVRPVCFSVSQQEPTFYSSRTCNVIGWGQVQAKGAKLDDLQEISANLLNISDCQIINNSSTVSNVYSRHLSDNMICSISDGGHGLICNGDSGSSLACDDGNGVWHLVGIVSWKFGKDHCGREGYPDAQSRVSKYLDWIKNTTTFYSNDDFTTL